MYHKSSLILEANEIITSMHIKDIMLTRPTSQSAFPSRHSVPTFQARSSQKVVSIFILVFENLYTVSQITRYMYSIIFLSNVSNPAYPLIKRKKKNPEKE